MPSHMCVSLREELYTFGCIGGATSTRSGITGVHPWIQGQSRTCEYSGVFNAFTAIVHLYPQISQRTSISARQCEQHTHTGAYALMIVGQLILGVSAAPFNTLAYVYIDENIRTRESTFALSECLQ